MNPQEIVKRLRERQKAYEQEASGHEVNSSGWNNWQERATLMKEAADCIEKLEKTLEDETT